MSTEALFSDSLKEFVARQSDPVLVHSEESLLTFRTLLRNVPAVIELEVVSADAFQIEVENIGETLPNADTSSEGRALELVMSHYWRDQASLALGFRAMVLLRSAELLLPALPPLDRGELIGPAVLARSALELAAIYTQELHKLVNLFKAAASSAPGRAFVMKNSGGNVLDPEKIIVRAIWGWKAESRAASDQPEELRQLNAITAVQKLGALLPQILEVYNYLCQIAHPNVAGNARFWAELKESKPGRSKLTIRSHAEGPEAERIRQSTLWALGWSAANVTLWSGRLVDAVEGIHRRWPEPRGGPLV